MNGRQEAVSPRRNSLYKRGRISRIPQRLPDFADRSVHPGLDVNEYVLTPKSIDDVAAANELASPMDQQDQNVHRLTTQFHSAAEAAQLAPRHIELEIIEAENNSAAKASQMNQLTTLQNDRMAGLVARSCNMRAGTTSNARMASGHFKRSRALNRVRASDLVHVTWGYGCAGMPRTACANRDPTRKKRSDESVLNARTYSIVIGPLRVVTLDKEASTAHRRQSPAGR
jgi:hypothetical protein